MTLKEYSKLALRTDGLKQEKHASSESELYIRNTRLVHASLGFNSELAEFITGDNYEEEIGDMFWYLNVAYDAIGADIDEDIEPNLEPVLFISEELPVVFGEVANSVKRLFFYSEDIDGKCKANQNFTNREYIHSHLQIIKDTLIAAIGDADLDLEDVLEKNIKKLEKRYPKLRFDSGDAIDRNVKEEQKTFKDDLDEPLPPRTCGDGEVCDACQ